MCYVAACRTCLKGLEPRGWALLMQHSSRICSRGDLYNAAFLLCPVCVDGSPQNISCASSPFTCRWSESSGHVDMVLTTTLQLWSLKPKVWTRRRAGAFVQLTKLLTLDSDAEARAALAGEVLDTLTALLAGNSCCRLRLAQDVGYDTLLRALLQATGPQGPQRPVLVKLMGPVFEARL